MSHIRDADERSVVTHSPGRTTYTTDSGDDTFDRRPPGERWPGGLATVILLLGVVVAVAVIVAQNLEQVAFDVLFWEVRIPLAVLLLSVVVLAVVVDDVVGFVRRRR